MTEGATAQVECKVAGPDANGRLGSPAEVYSGIGGTRVSDAAAPVRPAFIICILAYKFVVSFVEVREDECARQVRPPEALEINMAVPGRAIYVALSTAEPTSRSRVSTRPGL